GCCASAPAKADDGVRRSRQPDSHSVGEWYWLRRDEADCRPHGRRNDYVHDSRADSGPGVLRVDERKGAAAGHVAAGTGGVTRSNLPRRELWHFRRNHCLMSDNVKAGLEFFLLTLEYAPECILW